MTYGFQNTSTGVPEPEPEVLSRGFSDAGKQGCFLVDNFRKTNFSKLSQDLVIGPRKFFGRGNKFRKELPPHVCKRLKGGD